MLLSWLLPGVTGLAIVQAASVQIFFGNASIYTPGETSLEIAYVPGHEPDSVFAEKISQSAPIPTRITVLQRNVDPWVDYLRWCHLNLPNARKSSDLGNFVKSRPNYSRPVKLSHVVLLPQGSAILYLVFDPVSWTPTAGGTLFTSPDSIWQVLQGAPLQAVRAASASSSQGSSHGLAREAMGLAPEVPLWSPRFWRLHLTGEFNFGIGTDEAADPNIPSQYQNLKQRFDFEDFAKDGPFYYSIGLDWFFSHYVGARLFYARHSIKPTSETLASMLNSSLVPLDYTIQRQDIGCAITVGPWLDMVGTYFRPYGLLGIRNVDYTEKITSQNGYLNGPIFLRDVTATDLGTGVDWVPAKWISFGLEVGVRIKEFKFQSTATAQPDGGGDEVFIRFSLGGGMTE
jgi:hypothetical protein